jgi:hypothetical protein
VLAEGLEIAFLLICTGVAAGPLCTRFGAVKSADLNQFTYLWLIWIIAWGTFAVLTALGRIVFDPVILRLAALFGGQVLLGIVAFASLPRLRRAIRAIPLTWLVGWQMARVVGGFFLLGAALGQVSMPFAAIAGVGDMAVGFAAWLTLRRMRARPGLGPKLAVRHMVMGLTDFAVAISTAIVTGAVIGWPYVMIPLFLVPMAVLAHLAVWDRVR